MVKLKGPLFSMNAHGSLGPRLTYQKRRSGAQVRFQRPNTDRESTQQIIQRGYFQTATEWWGELTQTEKDEWRAWDC